MGLARTVWTRGEGGGKKLVAELGDHLDFRTIEDDSKRFDLIWRIEKIIPGSSSGLIREERLLEDAYAFVFGEAFGYKVEFFQAGTAARTGSDS